MSDALATYLDDHLAGANLAVELLESLRRQHAAPAGALSDLLTEVEEDRAVLKDIVGRAGHGAPVMKEAAAWVVEKLSKLKLSGGAFGSFEALETSALGILGKLALWEALAVISDPRLRGVDFHRLIQRATDQHARAEELRLNAAPLAFSPELEESDRSDAD